MWTILITLGMIAVGFAVWKALERQGPATPENDDPPDSPDA
jgi:hypothetical protein